MDNMVWVIEESYDNCAEWDEDRMTWDRVIAITKTKEEAEKMIKDLHDRLQLEESVDSAYMKYNDNGSFLWLMVSATKGFLGWKGVYEFTIENFELGKFKNIEL